MLDFSHVPSNQQDRQIFYAISGSNSWQTWCKPRGAKMVQIMCVGAGGGGAPGRLGGSYSWGGGGGASGGITKAMFPAFLIPDILYVQVGIGGRGGIATTGNGTIGTKGTDSIVSISATASANSVICIAPGGNASAVSTDGSSGYNTGGTSTTYTSVSASFIGLGVYSFEPTIAGKRAASVADGSDASTVALSNSILTGGAGGGSSINYLPGSIFAAPAFLLTNVLGSSQNDGIPGQNGYGLLSPIFCGTGGAGGAGNSEILTINGGRGGDGFIGCGGGGGGGSRGTGTVGGNGGNGGDGIVFITTIF